MRDHVQPGPALVLGLDDVPRRVRSVGVGEHLVLGPRELLPAGHRLDVGRRQLPLPHRVGEPRLEAPLLLGVADREPVLAQQDAVLEEQPLEDRALAQEAVVLLGRAVAHDRLDAGPVVPAAVEERDLAGGRQVLDVALEVPLRALAVRRHREGDDPGHPRVEELGDPLDGAALAGRVAALEDDRDPGARRADPLLHQHELGLESLQLGLVGFARYLRGPVAVLGHSALLRLRCLPADHRTDRPAAQWSASRSALPVVPHGAPSA